MACVIGLDGRELLGARTGVGRYLGELLTRWAGRSDGAKFLIYTPEELPRELTAGAEQRLITGGRGTWWEQTTLRTSVNRDAPDVFFAPAYTAPMGLRMPFAVTIHDVSFSAHPEWYRPREGLRRRWLTRRTARSARRIFTDSRFSRGEIERHYAVPRDRIDVIPPGVAVRGHPSGTREPIVLYIGTLFTRRRLPDLIAAFAAAARDLPQARLVIVGENRTWPPQDLAAVAAAHGVAARTEFRSYLADQALAALHARAAVFAFLSEYEGFGLTPLEALAAGLPVVVLDTPVSREVYRDAAIYVRGGDIDGAAAAIRRHLLSPGTDIDHLTQASDVVSRYSWDEAATRTLGRLEEIARG